MSGLFVAIEGPGGAGKSTVLDRLGQRLWAAGRPVVTTTEPSHAPLGRFARTHAGEYQGLALACLVAADRYHHLETVIRPALSADRLVLSDRYVASSLVIQAGLDTVPRSFVHALNAYADPPDATVILTATPDMLRDRLARRGSHGRFEDDPDNSAREVDLYCEVAAELREGGGHVLTVDTAAGIEKTVSRLAETLQALWSHRHRTPAA